MAAHVLSSAPQAEQQSLLTCKEAMASLRVSRSTLSRLMWSGQLAGHNVGSTWRFYPTDLQASVVCISPVDRERTDQGDQARAHLAMSS